MKISRILVLALMAFSASVPAYAGAFSFNKAPAEKMVADCQEEGIDLTMEEAQAIVAARANKTFLSPQDLEGLLPPRKIAELDPIEEDEDLIFNPNAMPGMKAY